MLLCAAVWCDTDSPSLPLSLSPLSQFGSKFFFLDQWQKDTLELIHAGRSVVVSAPTSSGKTVLGKYVEKESLKYIQCGEICVHTEISL